MTDFVRAMPTRAMSTCRSVSGGISKESGIVKNRKAVANALGASAGGGKPPSLAATDDKKKPKGKGKGRSRSSSPVGGEKKGICFAFRDNGKCDKGKSCPYAHDRSPSPPGKNKDTGATSPRGILPCKYFAAGSCKFGDKCTFKHTAAAGAEKEEGRGRGKGKGKKKLSTEEAVGTPAVAVAVQWPEDDVRYVPRKVSFGGGTKVRVFTCEGVLRDRPKKGHNLNYRHPVS